MTASQPTPNTDVPPYPADRIANAPFPERIKLSCQNWAHQSPKMPSVMALYWAKYFFVLVGAFEPSSIITFSFSFTFLFVHFLIYPFSLEFSLYYLFPCFFFSISLFRFAECYLAFIAFVTFSFMEDDNLIFFFAFWTKFDFFIIF